MKIDKFNLDDGTYIRFKKTGSGPPILLLHTFRNRLEYSDKLGKLLEDEFTVYSIDLPGFGDSPINIKTNYNLDFFTKSIVDFVKQSKIKNLTIAGESIGATLAASVSVQLPKVVKKIFMFNTYDYDSYFGEGIQRGNFFAKFILFHVSIPVIAHGGAGKMHHIKEATHSAGASAIALGSMDVFSKKDNGVLIYYPNTFSLSCFLGSLSKHSWDMFLEPGHISFPSRK